MATISVDSARSLMLRHVSLLQTTAIPIENAAGYVLAESIFAPRDVSPFRASAMDGFAIRACDAPGTLRIIGESAAGSAFTGAVDIGSAVRIFTGAPLPVGADTVVPQERAQYDETTVYLAGAVATASNVREAAFDFKIGTRLLAAGLRLQSKHIALIAAAGIDSVSAVRPPCIGILATGTELLTPGAPATTFQIYDSVSYGLAAAVQEWGCDSLRLGPLADDSEVISTAVNDALHNAELLVVISRCGPSRMKRICGHWQP
jgi:molybdopterin molybdotransferase